MKNNILYLLDFFKSVRTNFPVSLKVGLVTLLFGLTVNGVIYLLDGRKDNIYFIIVTIGVLFSLFYFGLCMPLMYQLSTYKFNDPNNQFARRKIRKYRLNNLTKDNLIKDITSLNLKILRSNENQIDGIVPAMSFGVENISFSRNFSIIFEDSKNIEIHIWPYAKNEMLDFSFSSFNSFNIFEKIIFKNNFTKI